MATTSNDPNTLPGTGLLMEDDDFAVRMVDGLHAFLDRELARADDADDGADVPSEGAARERSLAERRGRLARLLGVADTRQPAPALDLQAPTTTPPLLATTPAFAAYAIRWSALDGLDGEGLLLEPVRPARANVIALPDADWPPEQLAGLAPGLAPDAQFARRLAERDCRVVVPALIDRDDTWSGNSDLRMTNQPHREYVYRMAFELGRHILGYEVQKVLALVDHFTHPDQAKLPVLAVGYGEGGLLALYTAALEPRIAAAGVSGVFRNRRAAWQEPIYRDVWRLLRGFGDAAVAALIAPRRLVVEACPGPTADGPPPSRAGRTGAAPGQLAPAPAEEVRAEVARARRTYDRLGAAAQLVLVEGTALPGSDEALDELLASVPGPAASTAAEPAGEARLRADAGGQLGGPDPAGAAGRLPDSTARQRRQVTQAVLFTQRLLRAAARRRDAFWSAADPTSPDNWQRSTARYRDYLWDEVLGRCPPPSAPPRPRSRQVYDRPGWTGYEVRLDLWPDVFAYGVLLVPKGMAVDERRPVVVCQHGLEGRPQDTIDKATSPYRDFAARLADRGYVVYAPQNPYVGGDAFRSAVRKAHLLGWTIYSFILAQHELTLSWLAEQPFVDPARIAFYGLSYGGKTAMRIPALLPGYCLSICSGDFNEWIVKCASTDLPMSYMFTGEYEMFEFDLGNTFNYAELAGLIAPRPFMVERGHRDGVGLDEWVAFEYAKVRRRYADLHLPERTAIAFFEGGHMIEGTATFAFLDRHLGWTPRTA